MSPATIEPSTPSATAHRAGVAITCLALAIVWHVVSLERSVQLAFLGVLTSLIAAAVFALLGDDVPRPRPQRWVGRSVGVGGGLATTAVWRHHRFGPGPLVRHHPIGARP